MSSDEHIFLRTGLSPAESADRLAEALDATVAHDDEGRVFVGRSDAEHGGEVGGQVYANMYGSPPDPEPDEITLLDHYDIAYEVRATTGDEEHRRAEAQRLFTDITQRLPWPAALVHALSSLGAAFDSVHGRTDFPPGTTPDMAHEHLWHRYADTDLPA